MTDVAGTHATAPVADDAKWQRVLRSFAENKQAVFGLALLVVLLLAALLAPVIAPQNPYDLAQISFLDAMMRPGEASPGGILHVLGTDSQGRDLLSAILYGLRISIVVSASATLIALVIGLVLGLAAGYFGGRFDAFLMRLVDVQISIPGLLIALLLLVAMGPGVGKLVIAMVAIYWAYFARIVRGVALVERKKEYVEAAICLALPRWRIVLRHLLVNCLPPVMVVGTVLLARAVLLEASLSYLGLGVPVTQPSLGLLIANGFGYLMSGEYWVSFFPGVALVMLIFGVNLVGDHLRDVLNPRLQR
ncbi:ABC transporter permease [Propylenella binzhouense]|uniref:ABC transporter permease n=1 Tax=Propylenella binzhouense TaxID=2555902 RepID=A0A964WT56_9HYPH|nr:ABC transporter permease [Propylenella binzhouense]MYZ47677.1 ABC transporter permease [Propylenella binzhouense]